MYLHKFQSFVPSGCVLVDGTGVVQPNVVITTQYQATAYQASYSTVSFFVGNCLVVLVIFLSMFVFSFVIVSELQINSSLISRSCNAFIHLLL